MTEERREVSLQEARMGLAEHKRHDYVVNAAEGTTIEDVQKLAYFAHVSKNLEMYDHIEVRIETGEWVANFIVTEVGSNYAKVFLTEKYDLTKTTKIDVPDAYKVEWKGPQHKFVVIRISDNEVVQKDFGKKEDAAAWLSNHLQVVG